MSEEEKSFNALVKEQLAVVTKEVLAEFDRKSAEYEEKLRLSKEEGQRKERELARLLLTPEIMVVRGGVHIPKLKCQTPQTQVEPEQSNKQEEGEPPEPFPEPRAGAPHRENISTEPHVPSESEEDTEKSSDTDNDDDWEPGRW